MRVRTLDVPGLAAGITLYPEISRAGDVMIEFDRHGGGWHALRLSIDGPRSDGLAYLLLTPGHARDLSRKLARLADFTEARAKGEAGPCLCTAWSHNLYDCPNAAALDYMMCRECWTPEAGQQGLTMGHGQPKLDAP